MALMASNPLVILIDESRFFLNVMRQFLGYSPVRTTCLEHLAAAGHLLRNQKPELIFLDRGAPEYSGIDLCTQIKSDSELGAIPLVLLAAKDEEEERALCLKAGCEGILTKPLDRRAFLAMGRRFLPSIDRREQRVLCSMTVYYRTLTSCCYGHSIDISAGGMFIESENLPNATERLRLSFNLPGCAEKNVDFDARVVWLNQAENPGRVCFPSGFGVEFIDPSPSAQSLIRKFVLDHSAHQEDIREKQWRPTPDVVPLPGGSPL